MSGRCRCNSPRRLERLHGAAPRCELGPRRAAPSPALVFRPGRSRQRAGRRRPNATPPRCAGTCHARCHARTERSACYFRACATCVHHACAMHAPSQILPGAVRPAGGDAAAARPRRRRQRQGPRGRRAALRGLRCWEERRPAAARRPGRSRGNLARRADCARCRGASRLRPTHSRRCSPSCSIACDVLPLHMGPQPFLRAAAACTAYARRCSAATSRQWSCCSSEARRCMCLGLGLPRRGGA